MHQAVREKLAELVCYREGINAHLTAAVEIAEESPGGLLMPNQSLLYTGRVLACSQLPAMMHLARELCGGQICITPDAATFRNPETAPWMEKFYSVNEGWGAEDRRKLLAFGRDLLNSDYAGHRLTFELFARPALELLAGESEPILPLLSARFEAPFRHKLGLTRFLPARLSADGQHLRHIPWQGSSDIPALARANCFLVADHDRESWNTGDSIRVLSKP